jgi:hypothetical protein
MTVFIEKPSVTSSNFYETKQNASTLIKLSLIKFVKKALFCVDFFSIKTDFKVLQLLNG